MSGNRDKITAAAPGRVVRRPVAGGPPPAPRPRGLRIVRGDAVVAVALDEERRTLLGRHDAADVAFDAPEVSRLHGALSFDGERWWFQDLGSSNGSRLDKESGATIALGALEKAEVGAGDVLVLGTDACRVELLAEAPAPVRSRGGVVDDAIAVAARTALPVLFVGPSGAGKTHAARALHEAGGAGRPWVALAGAKLKDAAAVARGVVEAAGGTLFLDGVEELSETSQGVLLEVLEGEQAVRVVSSSRAPLPQSGLRAELCERLAAGHVVPLPTLDERRGEIPALVRAFAEEQARMLGVRVDVPPDVLEVLERASWPGHVRQLRAAIATCAHAAVADGRGFLVRDDVERHLADRAAAFRSDPAAVKPNPRHLTAGDVRAALARHDGNQSAAARELGIARNTLLRKMKDFDIGGDA